MLSFTYLIRGRIGENQGAFGPLEEFLSLPLRLALRFSFSTQQDPNERWIANPNPSFLNLIEARFWIIQGISLQHHSVPCCSFASVFKEMFRIKRIEHFATSYPLFQFCISRVESCQMEEKKSHFPLNEFALPWEISKLWHLHKEKKTNSGFKHCN